MRDNNFIQVHLELADHPAVLEYGHAVDHVFTLILRIARAESLDGRVQLSRITPKYLRLRFRINDNLPDAYLADGLAGCLAEVDGTPSLLCREADAVRVRAWEKFYGAPAKTGAERQQRYAEKKRQSAAADAHAGAVTSRDAADAADENDARSEEIRRDQKRRSSSSKRRVRTYVRPNRRRRRGRFPHPGAASRTRR